ncbi:magnesium-translocating P-type ATPase [Latilactobacillus fragifolii]|uniref:magnesium-translocating P-type ATPase n=1 Tax=Latilactobacillus fragifolii TaxID=2814244 RepID=UPI001F2963BC|nr:magnesium-translocating P-type ATPase [Latilactobacillus fragifolii]
MAKTIKLTLNQINQLTPEASLEHFETDKKGLSQQQRTARLQTYGENTIQKWQQRSLLRAIWQSVQDPFIGVLAVLMTISWLSRDLDGAIVMLIMIIVSSSIRFVQERKSEQASIALQAMLAKTSRVLIAGQPTEVAAQSLVPGDIVQLQTGDLINADLKLLASHDLQINQSSLTGESKPVSKKITTSTTDATHAADMASLLLMGSTVVNGQATALVIATGQATCFSAIVTTEPKSRTNQFDAGLKHISWLLIRMMLVLVPFVFVINGVTKGDWQQSFFFAIAVAVGLTPEMLPMIVNSNLAKGSIVLSQQQVIVKQLKAIQNLGAMSVLCTDKTGTLTEDHIKLMYYADILGVRDVQVLRLAYLNAKGQSGWQNLLDEAIIHYYEQDQPNDHFPYQKLGEIPFNFERRRLTVWLKNSAGNQLVTKGAFEEVLAACSQVRLADQIEPLTEAQKQNLVAVHDRLAQQGMRMLAVAYQDDLAETAAIDHVGNQGLIFAGFLGFLDPPKQSAITAIQQLQAHHVAVKILTGDSALTTQQVAQKVGIANLAVTTGEMLETLTDSQVSELLTEQALFAKLAPLQKARLIRLLQAQGEVVGFMGDGINDTTALKQADVGISVDNAADLTKDASDVILLEKDLNVLEHGVLEGRRVFINMYKYIRITLASNLGNVLSVLVASICLPFLPMLSLQILVQNLLYDVAQLWLPWDRVAEKQLRQPTQWATKGLLKSAFMLGPLSSMVDIVTFAILWFGFGLQTPAQQGAFQASWFVVGLFTQMLVVYVLRTPASPLKDHANWRVYLGSLISLSIGCILVLTPLRQAVDFQAIPAHFGWIAGALVIAYLLITNAVKNSAR